RGVHADRQRLGLGSLGRTSLGHEVEHRLTPLAGDALGAYRDRARGAAQVIATLEEHSTRLAGAPGASDLLGRSFGTLQDEQVQARDGGRLDVLRTGRRPSEEPVAPAADGALHGADDLA